MAYTPQYKRPPLTPQEAATKITSETMERRLIFGLLMHSSFYMEARDTLCPYDAEAGEYRPDFTVPRYNVLYRAIDAYWRYFDNGTLDQDLVANVDSVMAYVVDWANNKAVTAEICVRLQEEMVEEKSFADGLTLEECFNELRGPAFRTWLEKRMMVALANRITTAQSKGKLNTIAEAQALTAGLSSTAGYKSTAVDAFTLLRATRKNYPVLRSSLSGINRAIGGGFCLGEAWMGAALTGCGKTILANQLAWDFAKLGSNVLLVTTEQRPPVLLPRIVSNVAAVPFDQFLVNTNVDFSDIEKTTETPYIPEWLWTDNTTKAKMLDIEETLRTRMKFLDWSSGNKKLIETDLRPEILLLRRNQNWTPHVIIFDWLGGALALNTDPNATRLLFKNGSDYFAALCQGDGYLGIMMAQLAQGLALNKKVVHINMLAEAKNTADKFDGFMGVSGLHESEKDIDDSNFKTKPKLLSKQYIHLAKTRNGAGGVVPVLQQFRFQRFGNAEASTLQSNPV